MIDDFRNSDRVSGWEAIAFFVTLMLEFQIKRRIVYDLCTVFRFSLRAGLC